MVTRRPKQPTGPKVKNPFDRAAGTSCHGLHAQHWDWTTRHDLHDNEHGQVVVKKSDDHILRLLRGRAGFMKIRVVTGQRGL